MSSPLQESDQEPVGSSTQLPGEKIAPHSLTAKIFHWGFIVVFLYALTKQLDEVEELEDVALLEYEMVFASLFLILLLARYLFMRFTRPTALPQHAPRIIRNLARAAHLAMYVSLGMIAVTGLAIGALYAAGLKSGDMMNVALVIHELSISFSYLFIIIHVVAAVHHRSKGDGIWNSMVPFWKEN